MQSNYDLQFVKTVYDAPLFALSSVLKDIDDRYKVVRIKYTSPKSFKSRGKKFGIRTNLTVRLSVIIWAASFEKVIVIPREGCKG